MNVLRVRCECNSVLRIPEEKIARGGKCPTCGRLFPPITPAAFAKHAGRTLSAGEMQSLAEPEMPPPTAAAPSRGAVWQPGKVVEDKFEVKGFLGEGTFGAVWHVWDREHELDLAVKELRPDKQATPRRRQNFLREARAWVLSLGLHPHVVTAWWVLDVGGTPCLFLEYCPGGSLAGWIEEGKTRDLAAALDLGIQLCWGLAHCHAKGMVHRDFKPANVILGAHGEAKITDFGTVKFAAAEGLGGGAESGVIHDLRRSIGGQLQGTPPYMPPEQWHPGASVDGRADLYALGVTLFEMLTGEFPICAASRDIPAWIAAHHAGVPRALRELRPEAPAALDALIRQCLAKSAGERPAAAADVAQRLAAIYQQVTGRSYERPEPREAELLADSKNNQGVSLTAMGDAAEARTAWEEALRHDPSHAEATYNLGMTRWRAAEIDDVALVRSLKEVCAAQGEQSEAACLLAQVHLERSDCQGALELLQNVDMQGPGRKKRDGIMTQAQARLGESGRCLRTFEGDTHTVSSVYLSSDGSVALSGGYDNTLKLWEVSSGRCLRTFKGHSNRVVSVRLSGDARLALSGSGDTTLKLWEVSSGRCLRTFQGHSEPVQSVCLSSDGGLALSGSGGDLWSVSESKDNTLKLWEVSSGRCLRTFQGHSNSVKSVYLSGDGRLALSGSEDNTLKLWEVSSGRCLRTFQGHSQSVESVYLSGDGRLALSGSWDNTLKLWEASSGRCLRTFEGHSNLVHSVCLSDDARLTLSGSADNTLKLWRIADSPPPGQLFSPIVARPSSASELNQAVQFTALLGQAPEHQGRQPARAIELVRKARALPGCARRPAALDAWRRLYAIASKTSLNSAFKVATMSGERGFTSVCLSGDACLALSGSYDKTLKLWEVSSGRCLRTFQGHSDFVQSVCLSGDARLAMSGSDDRTLKLWEVSSGRCLRTFEGHSHRVTSVFLTGDGRLALSGSVDKTLKLWEVSSGRCLRTFQGHSFPVASACLNGDGALALSGSWDNTLKLWEVSSARCLRTFEGHSFHVESVCLSGDGRLALSGSHDKTLKLWEVSSGRCLRTFQGHSDFVQSVCLSGDARLALSGSDDRTLKLWEVSSGRCLRTFEGHSKRVDSVFLSGDGGLALSGSRDGTIAVWFLDWELEARGEVRK